MKVDIIYGKSFFSMKEIDDSSVDLIFCDPPYGISSEQIVNNPLIGYKKNKGKWDNVSDEYLIELVDYLISDSKRVLKDGGNIFISGVYGSLIRSWNKLIAQGFLFKHHIIWHKRNPAPSIHRRSLTYSNEIILWFIKPGKWTFNYEVAKTYNGGKQLHDVWEIAAVKKQCEVTRKPPRLLEMIIDIGSNNSDIILDPCCGSGTTAEVAKDRGRKYIGYEVQEKCLDFMNTKGLTVELSKKGEGD